MSTEVKRLSMVVAGRVQGVGFRYFTREIAGLYGISGWVRNCFNSDVEVEAQGPDEVLQQFINELKKGPPSGYVNDIQTKEMDVAKGEKQFSVRF